MEFYLNYNNGYEVGVIMQDNDGYRVAFPLRNFGNRQGDAMTFKQHDCPRLRDTQLNLLIKTYKPDVKYIRVSERKFIKQTLTE